jgi:hypothetical protein
MVAIQLAFVAPAAVKQVSPTFGPSKRQMPTTGHSSSRFASQIKNLGGQRAFSALVSTCSEPPRRWSKPAPEEPEGDVA